MGYVKIPAAGFITKEFTSSGSWVCPGGVYSAEFLVVGGGGAGGGVGSSVATNRTAAGGGGGGAVKRLTLPVTPGSTYTITIGAGGTGAAAAIGGNGGYSEIVLSGTTLIRSLGGLGGCAIDTLDSQLLVGRTVGQRASGGGYSRTGTDNNLMGGGGGGADFKAPFNTTYDLIGTGEGAHEGSLGGQSATSSTLVSVMGRMGSFGFGAGGGGGWASNSNSTANTTWIGTAPYGAGAGAVAALQQAGTAVAGSAAIANTGSGGGGAASNTTTGTAAGGNGAAGIVRITYYA